MTSTNEGTRRLVISLMMDKIAGQFYLILRVGLERFGQEMSVTMFKLVLRLGIRHILD